MKVNVINYRNCLFINFNLMKRFENWWRNEFTNQVLSKQIL